MKLQFLTFLATLAMCPLAMGADSTERSSPLDNNAACMERTTDASTGNCVVKDEGTPRRTYPPRPSPAAAAPAQAPGAASPTVRKSAVGK